MARNVTRSRYHVNLTEKQREQLRAEAEAKGINSSDLVRRFLELGFTLLEAEHNPDKRLIIEEGGVQRLLVI